MNTLHRNAINQSGVLWLVLFLLISMFSACMRDNAEPQSAAQDASRLSFTELAFQHPERFVDLLKTFSAQAKFIRENSAADQQHFSDMPVEDALALLEGTAHYDFRVQKNTLSDFDKKEFAFTVDKVSSGVLSGAGVQNAYNQLYAAIQNDLSQQPGRILFLTDVTVKENGEENTVLAVTVLTAGNEEGDPPQIECGVQPHDYWRPGGDLGKCDGTQQPKDAADREMEIMNQSNCWPVCNGQTVTYWLLTIGEPFGYNDSPLGNLLWPMGDGGNGLNCLSPAQMQTNMNILNDIKIIYYPPPPYVYSGAWIRSTEFVAGDQFYTYHDGIMYYVFQFCTPGGVGGEP
ncbi:MAG: hypothetical protein ACKVU2_15880 [Saprospiraceae bacterium]